MSKNDRQMTTWNRRKSYHLTQIFWRLQIQTIEFASAKKSDIHPDLGLQEFESFFTVHHELEWVKEQRDTSCKIFDPLLFFVAESREAMISPPASHFGLVQS